MSWHGRLAIEQIELGNDALERLGGLLPWEEHRIRGGDWSPLTRRLEPAFGRGQQIVVSRSQEKRLALRDPHDPRKLTGEVVVTPSVPLLVITIIKPRREKKGGWVVPFDVDDRRDPSRLIRRKPPAVVPERRRAGRRPTSILEEEFEENAAAHEESNYTGNPRAAVDHLQVVDDTDLRGYAAEAEAIETVVAGKQAEQEASVRRQTKSLEKDLADALQEAAEKGIDTSSVRFVTERQIARLRARLERAA